MQLSQKCSIKCPACGIKQSAAIKVAKTAIQLGNGRLQVGEPYMICGFSRCAHLMRGADLDEVNDIPVKTPADFRRALNHLKQ